MLKDKLMPFGKYKGRPVSELSDGYLVTLYINNKLPKWLREYAEENINILKLTVKKNDERNGTEG